MYVYAPGWVSIVVCGGPGRVCRCLEYGGVRHDYPDIVDQASFHWQGDFHWKVISKRHGHS